MADSLANYDAACKRIRKENRRLLSQFRSWLQAQGLKPNTVKRHLDNVDFYINTFLLYSEAIPAKDGTEHVGQFLGYWFIKKAAWSSQAAIRSSAASLKKFYAFMAEQGLVSNDELQWLNETIKEEMPEWLATMDRYVDPDIEDMDEVWGLGF